MASFNHIGGAEPSTLTFKVATITQTRNSSVMHQEILSLGDPDSSAAIAAVVNTAPGSTAWGLVIRDVAPVTKLESTCVQGTSPWITQPTFPAGYISSAAQSGNSSGLTVRPVWSSSNADQPVRAVLSSTSADNPVNAAQAGSWTVRATLSSTNADNPVRAVLSSTGADNPVSVSAFPANSSLIQLNAIAVGYISTAVLAGNSSALSVRNVWSSTNTDQPVSARCFQSTAGDLNVTAIYPANYISTAVLGGNSSALSVRNVWSSTNTDQPVSARCFQSTGTDLQMTCANFSTAVLATIATNLQSSAAPSSNSSGLVVRLVVDNILTTASTNAFAASTSFSIQSSGASLRSYVVAYSILSTNAGPHKVKFYSSGTMTWPVIFAAVSSAVSGANLAVSAPGYLFRTASQEALTLQLGSGASTIGGYQVAVSYFRAP